MQKNKIFKGFIIEVSKAKIFSACFFENSGKKIGCFSDMLFLTKLLSKKKRGIKMKKERQKTDRWRFAVLGLLFWAIFMGLNLWVRIDCYGRNAFDQIVNNWLFLQLAAVVVLVFGKIRSFDEKQKMDSGKYTRAALGICLFLLTAVALEMGEGFRDFSVYESRYLTLGWIDIPKRYLFDIYVVMVFPLWTEGVFRAVIDAKNVKKAVWEGCFQIISLTVAGYLLFSSLPDVWTMDLAMVNMVTVSFGIYKYFWKKKYFGKKRSVAAMGIYVALWGAILSGRWDFGSELVGVILDRKRYDPAILDILMLQKRILSGEDHRKNVEWWLACQPNYIQQLLYHKGWFWAILVMFILLAFLVLVFRLLRFRSFRRHKGFLVYLAGAWILTVRVVMGIFYSFGIPYPELLPFAGDRNVITDSLILGLLFRCAWEDSYTESVKHCQAVDVTGYLPKQETYRVTEGKKNEEYEGELELFAEDVDVWSDYCNITCDAEWITSLENGELWAFSPHGIYMKDVFFMEYKDEKWYPVEYEKTEKLALKRYKKSNKPYWTERKYYTK